MAYLFLLYHSTPQIRAGKVFEGKIYHKSKFDKSHVGRFIAAIYFS